MSSRKAKSRNRVDGTTCQVNPIFRLDECDNAGKLFLSEAISAVAWADHPILSKIRVSSSRAVRQVRYHVDREVETVDSPGFLQVFNLEWDMAEVVSNGTNGLYVAIAAGAADLQAQTVQAVLANVGELCDVSGQTVRTEGDLSWDSILDGFEGVVVEFDDVGRPATSFVIHPDTLRSLPRPTAEQSLRLKDMLATKHEEHLARRRTRRLTHIDLGAGT